MNEEKINALKDALREVVQMITAREGPMPEDLKALLVQVMEHVATRIQQLRAEESPVEGLKPSIPQLEPGPFESSNVNSFKYDPDSQDLYVKFHGKDTANSGPTYKYTGIPGYIYDVFSRGAIGPKTSGSNKYHTWIKNVTPSLGGTMNALIKAGGFPYARIA